MTAAFWRLVQPLYLTNVNDLRTEFLARITRMYIEQDSRTDDERLGARGRPGDPAPLWRRALVHAGRCTPGWDGSAADRRHSAPTVVQLLPRRARVRGAGSAGARRLGISERGEPADLRADVGHQLRAAHQQSGRALSARRLGVHRRGVRSERRRDAPRTSTGWCLRGRRRSWRRASSIRHDDRERAPQSRVHADGAMASDDHQPRGAGFGEPLGRTHALRAEAAARRHATEPFGSLAVRADGFRAAEITHRCGAARVALA